MRVADARGMRAMLKAGSLVAATLALILSGCGEELYQPSQDEIDGMNAAAAEIASGKADNQACSGTLMADRTDLNRRIALTFDDGPNPETTPQVLEVLAAHNVKATFFVKGAELSSAAARDLVRRELREGHLVGNHSQSHLNLAKVTASTLRTEVETERDTLASLGIEPYFFRFPYGLATCSAAATVRGYGYHIVGWHVDSGDWCYAENNGYCSPQTFDWVPDQYRRDITGYVLSQARNKDGGVILFHDVHAYTARKLDEILTRLERDGFTFVRLDDLSTFPQLNGGSAPSGPWIGSPCTGDAGCTFSAGGKTGYCLTFAAGGESHGFCSLECEGYCPDRTGAVATFCVATAEGKGACMRKDESGCGAVPGTSSATAERYVGTSGASAATATVCAP